MRDQGNRPDAADRDGHKPILMVGHEPTGRWMRNSALDSPKFLATKIVNLMGWRSPPRPRPTDAQVAPPRAPEAAAYLFQNRCGACHTIGNGDRVGPDLAGVTTRRERGWLARYLKAPDRMLAEGDPIATALFAKYRNVPMPNLRLGDEDVAALIEYLETQGSRAATRE